MKSLSGKHQENLDVEIYERFFKDVKNGILMECGALDGISLSVGRFFELYLDWKCINVEPAPKSFAKLEINRPKSINLNYALYNKECTAPFMELNCKPKINKLMIGRKDASLINVNCITYEHITENILRKDHGIQNIDLLILDVEKIEMLIVECISKSKMIPNVLCVELNDEGKIKEVEKLIPEYKFIFSKYYNYVFKKNE
jgi:FkbM family methyltransferase